MKVLNRVGPKNRHAELKLNASGKMVVYVEPRLTKRVNCCTLGARQSVIPYFFVGTRHQNQTCKQKKRDRLGSGLATGV